MPPLIINCPQCSMQLRVPETMAPGTKVKCPQCLFMFETPPPGAAPPPSVALPEQYTAAPPSPASRPGVAGEHEPATIDYVPQGLSNDYAIDLSAMFQAAQDNWSAVVGPMIGYVVLLIPIVIMLLPCVGIGWILIPSLVAGVWIVPLWQLKGKSWSFGDFFGGFSWFGPLLGNFLLAFLIGIACGLPGGLLQAVAMQNKQEGLMLIAVMLRLVGAIVNLYFHIRGFLFAPLLIVDRNYGAVDAIKANWQLTEGHFWGWLGIQLLMGLINGAAAAFCLVPVLFTMPFTFLVLTAGYLQITGGARSMQAVPGVPRN